MNATDADGYIIYYKAGTDCRKDVGNTTQYTLLIVESTTFTVRAYQDLLGPNSYSLRVQTVEGEKHCSK